MQDEAKTKDQLIDELNELRRKSLARETAEDQLGKSSVVFPELRHKTPEEIIHELHVHQIKLEMQNEQLKRVQLELEHSRNKYQDLYDFAPVGYFTLDRKGLIKEANLTGANLLGMPGPKLIGRGFGHFVSPESLDQWDKHIIGVFGHEEKDSCELSLKREDGSSFYARLESVRLEVPAEPEGAFGGGHVAHVVVTDITDRKHIEKALRESEERYRTVADLTYNWEYWVDAEGNFLYCSPSCDYMTGYSAKEFISDPDLMNRIVHPDDFDRIMNHFHVSRKVDDIPFSLDFRIIHRDGHITWVNHACQPVFGKEGQPLGRRGSNRDITDRKMVEESLKLSEERYRRVSSITSDIAYSCCKPTAATYSIDWMTGATERTLGYSVEDIKALKCWRNLVVDEDLPIFDRHVTGLSPGTSASCELRLRHKDGSIILVSSFAECVMESGSFDGLRLYGGLKYITERKQMEKQLHQTEERYRSLVEDSFDGIFVQKGSKTVFANSRLYEMLGYSPGELEGMDHWLVYHPDYQDLVRQRAMARMRGEDVISQYEIILQRKDGSSFPADISARLVHVDGEPGIQIWLRDISGRRRSEEAQRRLAVAIDHAAEAVIITDSNGVIQYVNPAQEILSGYSRSELLGQTPNILKSDFQDDTFYDNLWDTINSGEVWSGRFVNKKKDGTVYHEDATISPIYDKSGNLTNFVAVKHDMTKQLEFQEQLLQAQKMEAIGTLAGGFAHDFNNKLQVIGGYVEMILFDKDLSETLKHHLGIIRQTVDSSVELIKGMMVFSRKTSVEHHPIELNKIVDQVSSMLTRSIPRTIEIDLLLADDLWTINAAPNQIDQILMNLAVNARDAMPDGGKLTIKTNNIVLDEEYCRFDPVAKPGKYALITVSDTGTGMSKKTASHIFEPFFTTKETGKGTGLGLAVVYGIVEQHGGRIICDSEPSVGTTFRIYFPAIKEVPQEQYAEKKKPPRGQGETVLVVDDEPQITEFTSKVLTDSNYRVITALNGKGALDLYEKHREEINLVILDLIMPEMAGKECLRALLRTDPKVRVLMISGVLKPGMAEDLKEAGAKGFVKKPFDMNRLLEKIRKIIEDH